MQSKTVDHASHEAMSKTIKEGINEHLKPALHGSMRDKKVIPKDKNGTAAAKNRADTREERKRHDYNKKAK
jgi:hypothetical protein